METTENKSLIETKVKCDGNTLLRVNIKKDPNRGLLIHMQSPIEWKMLKDLSKDGTYNFGKVRCHFPLKDSLDDIPGYFRRDAGYEFGDYPNLTLLLAERLKDGVTFEFGLFPITDEKINAWSASFKEQVMAIYCNYLKPAEWDMTFTTHMVEKTIIT